MILKIGGLDFFSFYFWGLAYTQIMELFIPIKITPFFLLILFAGSFYSFYIKGKNNDQLRVLAYHIYCMGCLVIYFFVSIDQFTNAYPAIFTAMIMPLIIYEIEKKEDYCNLFPNALVITYLVLNYVLFFSGSLTFFQYDGGLRYKGGSAHANMLGCILLCILLSKLLIRSKSSYFIMVISFILLCLNGSRTYILIAVALIFLSLIENMKKKFYKIMLLLSVCICVILSFNSTWNFLINNLSILKRFKFYGFSDNGRGILSDIALKIFEEGSLSEKIFGFTLAGKYSAQSPKYYGHSFGENSFLSILMLFGIIGLVIFLFFIIYTIKKAYQKNWIIALIIGVLILPLLTQDIILSAQSAIGYFGIMNIFYKIPLKIKQPNEG